MSLRCPNTSNDYSNNKINKRARKSLTIQSKESTETKTLHFDSSNKICFICQEIIGESHSCAQAMIQNLENKIDQDKLIEMLLNLKQKTERDDCNQFLFESETQPLIPYLHWGTNVVVTYNPVSQESQVREISRIIPDFSRTILADENRIFCIGGQDVYSSEAISSVFEIDIEENLRVRDKASMIQKRFHHTAIYDSKHEFIVVIGGLEFNVKSQQFKVLSHCELYRVQSNEWYPISSLNQARDTCAACLFDNQWIYVFGGRTSTKSRELTGQIERCFYTNSKIFEWEIVKVNSEYSQGPLFNVGIVLRYQPVPFKY
eukprot:403375172